MAAITRASTVRVRDSPTRRISPSCSTRNSFTWRLSGSSPTSSSNSVPPSASSNRPALSAVAPVNAPRAWPNSSDSSKVSGIAPEFTATKRWSWRGLMRWIARATASLPVPLSPVSSTVDRCGAARIANSITRRIAGDSATTVRSVQRLSSACSAATCPRNCSRSSALRSVSSTSSERNGFGR